MKKGIVATLFAAAVRCAVTGISLNLDDDASIKSAASTIAYGLMKYYTGNNTGDVPGNLPDPYYWWEAGGMFGTLVDYWAFSGDKTYNNQTIQAIVHQAADSRDFMPTNQTRAEGNDDQGFWVMTAMSAAENKFPDPPADQAQYLGLVQSVFAQYVSRWEEHDCGGGMRWQIFPFNNGFDYKNSISNGCFFNIAARLARYTGNTTYSDWASKIFEWEEKAGLIQKNYSIFDGTWIETGGGCPRTNPTRWSYNAGVFLHGAAAMYNHSGSDLWKGRTDGILDMALKTFARPDKVVWEQHCEASAMCNLNEQSYKGYFLRWLAATSKLAPHTAGTIRPFVRASAEAAIKACSGTGSPGMPPFRGKEGTACGFTWTANETAFDGITGVGEQMNALSAVMCNLLDGAAGPVTNSTGGTSNRNPGGGGGTTDHDPTAETPIVAGDRVGAGFVTAIVLCSLIAAALFVMR
ncbi:Acyl-CoA dehydrogenase family member 10 [Purpureocillium lavendulum]|uniref:Mannan endo-1,6-alpha-mannosidase n=1 Tax=Purpureocillium lavendulum TaxID=1247861 RepID=A0AB34FWQ8_9HYPO|nr:Acyl-CoA dehydrogenase family member 10 [Purpureocillium lavendulum]